MLTQFVNKFFETKAYAIKESILDGKNFSSDAFEISILRQTIKMATLLRNQEY
jgi:hypothetical protein